MIDYKNLEAIIRLRSLLCILKSDTATRAKILWGLACLTRDFRIVPAMTQFPIWPRL
jgi:hypothetical protein